MRTRNLALLGATALGGVALAAFFILGHEPKAASPTPPSGASLAAADTADRVVAEPRLAAVPPPSFKVATADTTGSISAMPAHVAPAPAARAAPVPAPRAVAAESLACRSDPSLLGVTRMVRIDTSEGPAFGFQHFKAHDFLQPNEVVLTFDDGPWPKNTPAVLAALAAQCTKATFFSIGKHAIWHPEILKQVAAQGHTVGSHTWSHVDLAKKPAADAQAEIERGISGVRAAVGGDIAPFFRFPQLSHPPEMVKYLGQRNIAIFSTDIDSFDFKTKKPQKIVENVMARLKTQGKGIVLMHDFQHGTAEALPALLRELKTGGYKIVHLTAREAVATLPEYDALVRKEMGGTETAARPTSSVVETVND